ncbi:hypothetical protein M514_18123 [Trichuris suis]|uniref:Uncharacterized protein n=1 Tax=Trichuris suis TaxID=68888 RepID=A0A085NJU2_9BILA|nr:hypothetical protein M514_18123 [Trichuris suis]
MKDGIQSLKDLNIEAGNRTERPHQERRQYGRRDACNPATWRLGTEDGLRPGVLDRITSRRPSVRIKSGVNMVTIKELAVTRLGTEDGLRPGVLDRATSRRPSVRIKSGVNMVAVKELAVTRLVKEGRNWPRAETQQAKVPASLQWWDSACELGTEDGLRPGVLDRITSRRPSVRIKSGVNMVTIKELAVTRLVKEGRNWPRAETQQAKVPASLQWWDSACELGTEDGLRPGVLDRITSRRPSVRIKSGVNMVAVKELAVTRLVKEGRNWPRAETQQAKVPASLQWWDSACE